MAVLVKVVHAAVASGQDPRVEVRTVVDQESPHYEPEDPESTEDVEDRVPAHRLTEVATERHRYDRAKGRPSVGECSESEIKTCQVAICSLES